METTINDDAHTSRHVSYEQVKTIIDFMGQHVEFATGSLRTLEARHTSKRLWNELTKTLNNLRSGTRKSSDGWSKYWSDFKNKLKNKVLLLKKKKQNGAASKTRPLTRLEKRALVILGPHFEKKTPHNSRESLDPFNDVNATSLPEVKQEFFQEAESNDFSHVQSENQQSDAEKESEVSEASNDEYVDDSEDNTSDPAINSLYPKWLVDIEKKRAEAELIRAKAEIQKAGIISKNAEAALIQAESLKKLSEAASLQAEAMLRIAAAMEAMVQRHNVLQL